MRIFATVARDTTGTGSVLFHHPRDEHMKELESLLLRISDRRATYKEAGSALAES